MKRLTEIVLAAHVSYAMRVFLGVITAMGVAIGISSPANANSVVNGGFETGDSTGWTQNRHCRPRDGTRWR